MENRKVKIDSGELQGIFGYDPRIIVFKGIPYAAPPVGKLRWRAPQPVEKWEGVRLCAEYGPMSIQKVPGLDPNEFWTKELHPVGPEFEMSEDCLYLNVFTPARKGDEKLPVLVYIHGGGMTGGYPYEIEFDWEHVARKGIVVVTIAYRLGMFGLFSHPWLTEESPDDPIGCYAYLDQQAAIQWTKRNIAAFGGDPDKITIAGQSAGSGSVMTQLTAPSGKDLFRAAIVQSGIIMGFKDSTGFGRNISKEAAYKNAQDFFDKLGIKSLEEARAIPAMELYQKSIELSPTGRGLSFGTPVDNGFTSETSVDAMLGDRWGDRPVIFGYNSGETQMFNRFGKLPQNMDEYKAFADGFGDKKDEFLKLAGCANDDDVKALFESDAFVSLICSTILAGSIRNKQGHKAWIYEFSTPIPGDDNPGVYHGAELPFAYDALARMWRPFTGMHYDMARFVSSYWINFIKNGDPNGLTNNGEQLPQWDAYSDETPNQMVFTDHCEQKEAKVTEMMALRLANTIG